MSRLISALMTFVILTAPLAAHPVPKDQHDRTIAVRLQKGEKPDQVKVRVEYRLEVDETTVFLNDMKEFRDTVNPLDYRGRPLEYYAEFAKIYGPIYADRVVVRVNKDTAEEFFRVRSHKERLQDDDGMNLGHLRCDFVFEGMLSLAPNGDTKVRIREQNYLFDDGQVHLSLIDETGMSVLSKAVPDDALRKKIADKKATPDEENRAREIILVFAASEQTVENVPPIEPDWKHASTKPATRGHQDHWFSLEQIFFAANYGIFVTLILCFVFGAAHALTPGHGKTLVAAYLVGERGTIWHACYLGLVTTLTHTGAVIGVAVIWVFLSPEHQQTFKVWLQSGLGLVMGLIVACMGFALLLQRLAGRADHVHLDGGHHHQPHTHSHATPEGGIRWRGLTLLGITGGMIPCWDAIAVLVASLGRAEFWFVLAAVLTFSAGLAVVLVAIGVLVVQAPRLVESRAGGRKVLQALPIVSAILVTLMGIWMCYESVPAR